MHRWIFLQFAIVFCLFRFPCADELNRPAGIDIQFGRIKASALIDKARESGRIIYVQSADSLYIEELRAAATEAGLLGTRVYAEHGALNKIYLADNLIDGGAIKPGDKVDQLNDAVRREIERVIHPGAIVEVSKSDGITKARPKNADDWSHPYHGPDNNPQSTDATAKAPYLTQFLADPWYVPMPQVTVTSGGRMFKAFGHIALKEREWPWLNTLVAINAYNGTHLWKRKLKPGFMIHRNTIIASPDTLFLADDESCKLIDAATGEVADEIVIPKDVDKDGVWKWMALNDRVLYVLVGEKEVIDTVIRGTRKPAGWPWSGMGKAYGGKFPWGFGQTLLAINPESKEILWKYKSEEPIDSRALCMAAGKLYVYSHGKYLASVDAKTGNEIWKTTDEKLMAAIGQHDRAQTASKGFASSAYAKANEKGIYFAGPQRTKIVAVSAKDGSLMWDYPDGNFQLVLRDDGLYAMGRMQTSKKFDYLTGKILADLQCYRGNCTRATATVDSIFTRGYRHTGTMQLDLSGNYPRRIPLMRPACQDGVIISNGQLFWGPWMCDCNHSLVGMISLAPAGDFDFAQPAHESQRLQSANNNTQLAEPSAGDLDWPSYRGDKARTASSKATVSSKASELWQIDPPGDVEPTAPVTAGAFTFWSGLDGVVRCAETSTGKLRWTAFTGGAVRFPPEVWGGRVYVGSGDGCVYCFQAATGQQLWRFRAAPAERRILVHGRLTSNWPVGSGVLVDDGVVYAAAGITSYDGTHVYALDAITGKIRWQNNSSGRLVEEQQLTGVSVQGHLLLHDDKLYLAGGNVVSPAIYDTKDGKCLNQLKNEWWDRPEDSKEQFPSKPRGEMFKRSPRGRELFLVDGKVRVFDQLLYSPPKYGPSRYFGGNFLQANDGDVIIRATAGRILRLTEKTDDKPVGLWQNDSFANPRAMALCKNAVVVVGQLSGEENSENYAISALDLNDGKLLWTQKIPGEPISWGIAVDRKGQVIVTLVDGRAICVGG